MTDLTTVARAYAAASAAFCRLRFAATLAATERKTGVNMANRRYYSGHTRNTPEEHCLIDLDKGFQKLKRAIELADSCKLDAAVAIVPMSAYAGSAVAAAVHNAEHVPSEAAYLEVVWAAIEAHETCDKAETIFRKGNDD